MTVRSISLGSVSLLIVQPRTSELSCPAPGATGSEVSADPAGMSPICRATPRNCISIDAAIFDDGEFIGPNKSELDQHFRAYVKAKQEYYKRIVHGLDSGLSLDEALAPIEAVVKANAANQGLDQGDVRKMWQRIAAPEVRSWRVKYGDQAAPELYRRALRTERFVIRRGRASDA